MSPADISPDWQGSTRRERRIVLDLAKLEGTPKAIQRFARDCDDLGDYWYWFTLSTLWVSYSGYSDLALWRRLFLSPRPQRRTSLMKPSELQLLDAMPARFRVFRAHRPGEQDWIAYTVDEQVAARFACERNVDHVLAYAVLRRNALALFTRRGEAELLVISPSLAQPIGRYEILGWPQGQAASDGILPQTGA